MNIRLGRIVVAATAAQILAVLIWTAILLLYGWTHGAAVQQFAYQDGPWFGLVSRVLLCAAFGFWAARGAKRPVLTAACVGLIGAVVTALAAATLAFGPNAPLTPLLVSIPAQFVGGGLGGWVAGKMRPSAT